jgi:Spy/CpxP family protein refolding chaperone
MTRKQAVLRMAAGVAAAFVSAQGQDMGPRGGAPPDPQTVIQMRVAMLATQLNLTDAQKTKATSIFTDANTAGASVRTAMQSNRESLTAAIKKNDTAAIEQLAVAAGSLSGQMTAIDSKAEAAFYALLTTAQQGNYRGVGGGPGGRMGPGGFDPSRMGPPPPPSN